MARARSPKTVPLMPLRSTVVYPSAAFSVQIGLAPTLALLAAHPEDGLEVVTAVDFGTGDDPIRPDQLEKIGVVCRLTDRLYLPGGSVQATVQGIRRVSIEEVQDRDGLLVATVAEVEETQPEDDYAEEQVTRILAALDTLASEVERVSNEVPAVLRMNVGDPGRFADLVATLAHFTVAWKDEVLQRVDVAARLDLILQRLEAELAHIRALEEGQDAAEDAAGEADGEPAPPRDRAADLRRQIRRLEVELGRVDPGEREAVQLLRRIEAADLPARVATRARQEVERLRSISTHGTDAEDARTYIDWLLAMPWEHAATEGAKAIDLEAVRAALDERLLGLDEPKERLLDDLAVARLRGDLEGPIPCIVGPPDVGKTALAEAVAAGLGRPIARVDLGGRGEGEIIGTRRTHRDATPGKLAQALRDVGVCDPVLLLEEVDQTGAGKVEGDPVEALEEALRWHDRKAFVDRYLDIELDLSRAVIITTAYDFARVPRDLRELMVEIRIAGYTPEEKVAIAREKILPRMIAEHGLSPDDIDVADDPLYDLIRGYARDSGLERVRRVLATILRTRARAKAGGDTETWEIDQARIEEILGPARYVATAAESSPEVGVVTGLAWTSSGGELLFIEALTMPGTGRLIITGHLGEVMKESVNAAYSYVRSRAAELEIADSDFGEIDVHVHFPVGAVPKDGPSAGIAVTLALASTLSGLSVRHDIAMTGEVTLRGKVLEVGGIKEKVLAGYRAGIRKVILPAGNERDLRDVPDETRENIEFFFVDRMDEVLDLALMRGPGKTRKARGTRKKKGEGPDPRDEQAARNR
jgi:ATP-dependent Lon protease